MTAKAGKGAGDKPRKKTSAAAKPPSDEVTLRTGSDTNGAEPSDEPDDIAMDTDLAKNGMTEDTRQDIEVPSRKGAAAESSEYDERPGAPRSGER